MAHFIQTGLSITYEQHDRLNDLAKRRGITRSEVVRQLIGIALPFAETGNGLNFGRLITILEFASLALDTLITAHAPEEADRLLDLAVENTRKFHTA